MKTLNIYAALLLSIFATNFSFAQKSTILNTTEQIKVWGNCETCKKRIENAAHIAGAATANWDVLSHVLAVNYYEPKTSSEKIQKAIAAAGHDTQNFKADDNTYNKLPSCCKYDRNTALVGMGSKMGCKMDCCKDKTCCDKNTVCSETSCRDMAECKNMTCCKS